MKQFFLRIQPGPFFYFMLLLILTWTSPCHADICSPDNWCWENPSPQGNSLNAIWGSSGSDVFAVGDSGTILHYDGSNWSAMESGTTDYLRDVWGSSGSDVFAVGDYGTILHYNGISWSAMTSGTMHALVGVWGSSGSDVFAVGGTILHYDGSNWSEIASVTTSYLHGIWGTSGSDIFAVGSRGTILHYNGSTWSALSTGTTRLYGVWGSSGSDIFAVGNYGTILHYDGSNWSVMASGTTKFLRDVWGSSGSDVFAVGLDGTILHYNGISWSPSTTLGTTDYLHGIWGSSGSDVFAVQRYGTILHYDGSHWSSASVTTNSLRGVWGRSGSDVFAVGDFGTILHYDGSNWSAMESGTTDYLRDVWGSSGSDVFAVGYDVMGTGGIILHYDGSNWSAMASGNTYFLEGVWGRSGSDVFAVGDVGTILHYDGSNWSAMESGTTLYLRDVWGSSGSDVFAVGDNGTILHYNGISWSEMASGTTIHLNGVWGSSGRDVFAVGYDFMGTGGIILHYDGSNWSEMASGTTDYLRDVWGSSGSDVFAVGYGGTILHYDGSNWSAMVSGTTYHWLNGIWGSSGSYVFAVGDYGTILRGRSLADNTYGALVIGVPGKDIDTINNAGIVHVINGSIDGLNSDHSQLWSLETEGIVGSANDSDEFGTALATGDFNGDSFLDLATGIPHKDIGKIYNAGAVSVIYGTTAGLSSTDNQLWSKETEGISGNPQEASYFGASLAAGDFNNDGFVDLAIGEPSMDIGTLWFVGVVHVIYGSAVGLSSDGSQEWSQDIDDIVGHPESGDSFGASLASGDFNRDGFSDLAIGVPLENIGNINNAGAVNIIYGSIDGLRSVGNQAWTQDSNGIPGNSEDGDKFGRTVSTGDFDHDGFFDLAIGVPFEDIGNIDAAGAVNIIYGSRDGLSSADSQILGQNTDGIIGTPEHWDWFGDALVASDFNHDSFSDLAIGVPGEDVGEITDAGAVNIIYGSRDGLRITGNQRWSQGTEGILGGVFQGDQFGSSLAAADLNNDCFSDLAVGVPFEDIGTSTYTGAVNVIYGTADGLSIIDNQFLNQDSVGIEGTSEEGDRFGTALTVLPGIQPEECVIPPPSNIYWPMFLPAIIGDKSK